MALYKSIIIIILFYFIRFFIFLMLLLLFNRTITNTFGPFLRSYFCLGWVPKHFEAALSSTGCRSCCLEHSNESTDALLAFKIILFGFMFLLLYYTSSELRFLRFPLIYTDLLHVSCSMRCI